MPAQRATAMCTSWKRDAVCARRSAMHRITRDVTKAMVASIRINSWFTLVIMYHRAVSCPVLYITSKVGSFHAVT